MPVLPRARAAAAAAAGRLMEVVVTAAENVKPAWSSSSSGLDRKGPFKLCFLDQFMNSHYTSMVFFYPAKQRGKVEGASAAAAEELKASLSKALVPFYPLAGRVRDNLIIDDFHAGVPFLEARAGGLTLSEFLGPPKLDLVNDLLPFEPWCLLAGDGGDDAPPQLAVQMSTFDCGGVALGINFHHKILDAATSTAFIHAWAATSSSSSSVQPPAAPDLTKASSLFPPQPSIPPRVLSYMDGVFFQNDRRTATRRFVFDEEAIAALRRRARVENPTRTEALSAFVWESALRAGGGDGDDQLLQCFGQAMNLRNRMGDRLSRHSVGNILTLPFSFRRSQGSRETMEELAGLIRRTTAGVDDAFLSTISGEEGYRARLEGIEWMAGRITSGRQVFVGTSCLSFDLHGFEVGGLGRPAWVCLIGEASGEQPCVENFMILTETGPVHRRTVEVQIRLDEEVMAGLERDDGFLEFASPNPPIITH